MEQPPFGLARKARARKEVEVGKRSVSAWRSEDRIEKCGEARSEVGRAHRQTQASRRVLAVKRWSQTAGGPQPGGRRNAEGDARGSTNEEVVAARTSAVAE